MKTLWILLLLMTTANSAFAQTNRIDIIRPDAPELAYRGEFAIGVRTLDLLDKGRVDVLNTKEGADTAYYDRPIRVEVWYPAQSVSEAVCNNTYITETRNVAITDAVLSGIACRDAQSLKDSSPYPLVILSHGYPGNRHLMSHLGENLATKGYVVVSIDHTDSTYQDQKLFASTLFNRAPDQRFVLNEIARFSHDENSFLNGLVDANNTAVVGFSMGGYGLMNNLGAAYNPEKIDDDRSPPNRLLERWSRANKDFSSVLDSRIRAGVAIAPWGMNTGYLDAASVALVETPTLYVVGSMDRTAGYQNGAKEMFEQAINSDRYLLTFENGSHSVAAPFPLPNEILNSENKEGASHYADPVWDSVRSNNILAHFVTAFVDLQLKSMEERRQYLQLLPIANEAHFSVRDGVPTQRHTYWKGFGIGTAVGLRFDHLAAGE
ncbi:MAG: dienelactone hydrolase [Pseudohongiellaceae bacterium]|nr:dienelactone hydrolase [Pseudohongiellaceae bacterium]